MVETRSKRRKRIQAAGDDASSDCGGGAGLRSWSDLPHDLLHSILLRLSPSIPDLLSFAAVCPSWRSLAASVSSFPRPPLLLYPNDWFLQTLTSPKPYPVRAYPKPLRARCLGCSHGHLIFRANNRAVLANVFTGAKILSPRFPLPSPYKFRLGLLTASPAVPSSCTLLMVGSLGTLLWRLDGEEWVKEEYLRYEKEVRSLALFNGLLYILDDRCWLKVVKFDEFPVTWVTLELRFPCHCQPPNHGNFGKYLVECGGELLLVNFVGQGDSNCRVNVYGLDLAKMKWVGKEHLGDWCLFIDVAGNSPMACPNPGEWGGRSNCVYVAGPGYDGWSLFPLDGSSIDVSCEKSALCHSYKTYPRWPSPVWIYPNKLL